MSNLDGNTILNDALACAYTGHPDAREAGNEIWVPADALTDYDLETAIDEATMATGDHNHALFEILLAGYSEGDPIWQEIEEAAARALRTFAEEIDEEYSQYFEDENEA